MSYKIAIASGKGGTGKTTVAVNLFNAISNTLTKNVNLVDCDVEEPNDLIFFSQAKEEKKKKVFQKIPVINTEKCTFCKKCVTYCEFNAISVIPDRKFAEVNASLCHSCGACLVACTDNAITEYDEEIGKITNFKTTVKNGLIEGELKVGSSMQTMLIKELKKIKWPRKNIVIYDAPPGTSCSVVESIIDVDFVILVSEPTPFGLYDMKLMVELVRELQKPFAVIVNKAGMGNNDIYDYLHKEQIELLGEIPFSRDYAAKYAGGELLTNVPTEIAHVFQEIVSSLKKRIN